MSSVKTLAYEKLRRIVEDTLLERNKNTGLTLAEGVVMFYTRLFYNEVNVM